MPLTKPFFRIARFSESTAYHGDRFLPYVADPRYCQERSSLCRAYQILQKDLERLFEYIEPCDSNKQVYSHRTFELLLRAATELEANCKGILRANDYSSKSSLNMEDYWKINRAAKLCEYKVRLGFWSPEPLTLQPFGEWKESIYKPLKWYQAYNAAKHNRDTAFHQSNLENTVQAVAGLLCILFAQFNIYSTHPYRSPSWFYIGGEDDMKGMDNSIFDIADPVWDESESYNFDWNTLKSSSSPYEKYSF